jgi:hypothetical protein
MQIDTAGGETQYKAVKERLSKDSNRLAHFVKKKFLALVQEGASFSASP